LVEVDMQAVLEIVAGPHLGKKTVVRADQVATFGRTERADFAFPLDPHMSGAHFVVEQSPLDCRIRDLDSGNGTFLNGKRIQEAVLHDADVIRAGKTDFVVHLDVAPAEVTPIPDYLKGIVPSTWRGEGGTPPPQLDVPLGPAEHKWPAHSPPAPAWEPPRLDVQPASPSFLPAPPPPLAAPPSTPAKLESASMSGTLRLVIEAVAGPHATTRASLRAGDSLKVGRTDRADLVLADDSGLSGLHFAMQGTPQGFELYDLGSTNGTYLNGESVVAAPLHDSDEIRAGQSSFTVRIEGRPAVAPPDIVSSSPISPLDGLHDADPRVRRMALIAAASTGQTWLLAHCRKLTESPTADNWDGIYMLAVLGKPAELPRIEAVCRALTLGPRRFLVCGAFGHPALVDSLLGVMGGSDAALAAVARLAFEKISGAEISTSHRATVVLDEGGPPTEICLPDVERAITTWKQAQAKFASSTRVCNGFDLSDRVSDEVFAELDMESRWETRLRGHYYGTWPGSVCELGFLY
jgi:pSer/pThr/pTyr-binding forkhead associated (FHA) protein